MTDTDNPSWCTEVGPDCLVERTIYGYIPSLAANSFFVAWFGVFLFLNIGFGIKWKTWTYMIAMSLGCASEAGGYVGRLMLWDNVFSEAGFQLQICLLIIAPAFNSAAIYVTLKHLVIVCGTEWSRLRPVWYTYVFITGDIISLILQGAGGGIAATADSGSELQDTGTNLMLSGVIFQVFVLGVFGILLTEYAIRTYHRRSQLSTEASAYLRSKKFYLFAVAVAVAYLAILARCIYRIPELAGGWGSELMRDETEFIALEGAMIALAVAVLTIFHPGYCFPVMGNTSKISSRAKSFSDSIPLEDSPTLEHHHSVA